MPDGVQHFWLPLMGSYWLSLMLPLVLPLWTPVFWGVGGGGVCQGYGFYSLEYPQYLRD